MITVQNDWVEYAPVEYAPVGYVPAPARRVAVRGGALCGARSPLVATPRPASAPPAERRAAGRHRVARGARPLRLTRRGRIVLVLLPAAVALSSAFVGTSAPFAQADTAAGARTVVVGTGDTLWSIAERVAPARDPREVVAALERANHLTSAVVLAGSRLEVPGDLGR